VVQKGARRRCLGVSLSIGAGAKDGDEQGQITLIENAIAKGDKGI
jgi:fructose transport system substrate-binding protein